MKKKSTSIEGSRSSDSRRPAGKAARRPPLPGTADGDAARHAETAYRESEEKFHKLLEIVPGAIVIHAEGKFIFMNKTGLDMFGARDLSEIVGLSAIAHVRPDYRENAIKRMMEIYQTEKTLQPVDEVLLDLQGRPIRCLVNSAIITDQGRPAMIAYVTDLTALDEYERSLVRYHHIVSASKECLAFIDHAGTLQAVNDAMATLLDRRAEDAIGMPFLEFMAPAASHDPQRLADFLHRALTGEEINDEALLDIPRQGHRHVELSLIPYVEGGAPTGCIVTMRDITNATQSAQRMLSAIQETREHIGMELHDGLSHQLLAVAVKSRMLSERLAGTDPSAAGEAAEIESLINNAIDETRRLALGLVPADLEHLNLAASLREIAGGLEKLGGPPCTLDLDESACHIGTEQSIHLYYIVREALANIIKHARARTAMISLSFDAPFTTLIVRDDGIGIGIVMPHAQGDPMAGMGLTIMRYRALLMGASLAIMKAPGGGTEILCRFSAQPKGSSRPA